MREICHVDPSSGFENFVREVHDVIERVGRGADAVSIVMGAKRRAFKGGGGP